MSCDLAGVWNVVLMRRILLSNFNMHMLYVHVAHIGHGMLCTRRSGTDDAHSADKRWPFCAQLAQATSRSSRQIDGSCNTYVLMHEEFAHLHGHKQLKHAVHLDMSNWQHSAAKI